MSESRVRALLIGNGINQLVTDQQYSWKSLLVKLNSMLEPGKEIDLNNEFKPFPLSFEEIAFTKITSYNEALQNLKNMIYEHLKDMPYTDIHEMIMKSSFKHIMTTNYDYTLEKSMDTGFTTNRSYTYNPDDEYKPHIEEKHSLQRYYHHYDTLKTVWHIHGEIQDSIYQAPKKHYRSKSILIGFEQYSSYLKKIQDYLNGGTPINKERLNDRLKKFHSNPEFAIASWIDFFFIADVNIIGFSLDFSEMHLWWILNKRNEIIRNKQEQSLIKNKIRYFYKSHNNRTKISIGEQLGDFVKLRKQHSIVEILTAMGVECTEIDIPDYKNYYIEALKQAEEA